MVVRLLTGSPCDAEFQYHRIMCPQNKFTTENRHTINKGVTSYKIKTFNIRILA